MKAVIYSTPTCVYCLKAKALCEARGIEYEEFTVGRDLTKEELWEKVGAPVTKVPQIFLDGEYVGGFDNLQARLGCSSPSS